MCCATRPPSPPPRPLKIVCPLGHPLHSHMLSGMSSLGGQRVRCSKSERPARVHGKRLAATCCARPTRLPPARSGPSSTKRVSGSLVGGSVVCTRARARHYGCVRLQMSLRCGACQAMCTQAAAAAAAVGSHAGAPLVPRSPPSIASVRPRPSPECCNNRVAKGKIATKCSPRLPNPLF